MIITNFNMTLAQLDSGDTEKIFSGLRLNENKLLDLFGFIQRVCIRQLHELLKVV